MNVPDEDIDLYQRQRLEAKKIHVRQIGVEIGLAGIKDRNRVIPALHALRRPTFFTRDHGFYHPDLRHPQYCLVYLNVARKEVADYIRLFLRHPAFRTQAKRILSKIGGSRKMPGRKIALNLRGLIFLPHIFLLKPGPVRDTPPRIFETIRRNASARWCGFSPAASFTGR
jgi:hypothetical protein